MSAIYVKYTLDVHVSTNLTFGSFSWDPDFKNNKIGTLDIGIPTITDASFFDWYYANVRDKAVCNYLTGQTTSTYHELLNKVPINYLTACGFEPNNTLISPSPYFCMMNIFPNHKDITSLFQPYFGNYQDYIFAITSPNSDYYYIVHINRYDNGTGHYWYYLSSVYSDWLLPKDSPSGTNTVIGNGSDIFPNFIPSEQEPRREGWFTFAFRCPDGFFTSEFTDYNNDIKCMWNGVFKKPDSYLPALYSILDNAPSVIVDPSNPYPDIPDSGDDEGGGGEQDFTSEETPISSLPSVSAADTGFTRLFNPTLPQLQSFASYVWTDTTFWDTLKNQIMQIIDKPMDYFISLNVLPCQVENTDQPVEVKLLFISTGKYMYGVTNQFTDVDCGYCKIPMQFDSALDNSPYTKVQLYLPYIGMVSLNADEVVGHIIHVTYRVDVFSGGCTAMVGVMDGATENIRYCYSGHCAINIPFTSANFSTYIGALIQTAKLAGAVAAGAAGAMGVADAIAGLPEPKSSETRSVKENADGETMYAKTTVHHSSGASMSSIVTHGLVNTAASIMGAKPQIERSGTFSGNTGYLALRYPYIIMESPNLCTPNEYGTLNGRPSLQYLPLANLTGYTKVQQMVLNGFGATNPELDEIGALLKAGVYL